MIGFFDRLLDTRRPCTMLVLFCLLLWLPGFFSLPPSDRDESRFAQATKQMIETGNLVRIMNGTEARNQKPIGIYWLQLPFAEAARATGVAVANPIWPYRIPSLLGGIAAVLLTYGLGRSLVGCRAALLAGAMLAACVVLSVETHIAKTDAALLGATTLAMLLLARAYLTPDSFGARSAVLFWLAIGFGVLLKGPITPMVAGLAAIMLALWDRRAGWLGRLRFRWGVPLLLLVVLPWFIAIGIDTHGAFFQQSVAGDLGSKMTGGEQSHGAPPGTHLLLLSLLAFPSTLPVLRSLADTWRDRRAQVTRFLIAWMVPSWLVMELVPTKLPHYTLPMYPALFLLAARWTLDPARMPAPRWLRIVSWIGFGLAAAILGLGSAALPPVLGAGWWLGLGGLAAAAIIAWLALRAGGDVRPALLAAPLLYWGILQGTLPNTTPLWIAPRVEAALAAHWQHGRPADAGFGAVGFHEPSLMFLAGTNTDWLPGAASAACFLAGGPDRVVLIDVRDKAAFLAAAQAHELAPHAFATFSGFNYSHGRRMLLTLYDR
jgi:4-amino-4-deoxy-L-arabinose transferase-like glycosyltransferase